MQWAQHLSGLTSSIFEHPAIPIPHLSEEKWITTLREFLTQASLQLHIPQLKVTCLQRNSDEAIMDIITNSQQWSNGERSRIQRCRIYLGATTIADLTTANGTHINHSSYHCLPSGKIISKKLWPHQPRPGHKHISTWKTFLDTLCITQTMRLRKPLGEWIIPPTLSRWNAFYDDTLLVVIIKKNNTWHHYNKYSKHRRYWCVDNQAEPIDYTPPTSLPNLQPLDILVQDNNTYHVSIPIQAATSHPIPTPPTTWQAYLFQLPLWERRMIRDMQTSAMSIWHHLTKSKTEVIIVTDGSYKTNKASYAWIMHDGVQQITTGNGMVSGNPITAFRSELFGIVAWYCCVYHAINYLQHDHKFSIDPYTDNNKVIQYHQQVLSHEAEATAFMDDYDLFIMLQPYHY